MTELIQEVIEQTVIQEVNDVTEVTEQVTTEDLIEEREVVNLTINKILSGFSAENDSGLDIIKGQPVALTNSGIQLACAVDERICVGFASEDILDAHSGFIQDDEYIELSDWTEITGEISLIPKQKYFLSDNPGMLRTSFSGFSRSQNVGLALTTKRLQINIFNSIKL